MCFRNTLERSKWQSINLPIYKLKHQSPCSSFLDRSNPSKVHSLSCHGQYPSRCQATHTVKMIEKVNNSYSSIILQYLAGDNSTPLRKGMQFLTALSSTLLWAQNIQKQTKKKRTVRLKVCMDPTVPYTLYWLIWINSEQIRVLFSPIIIVPLT